MPVPITATITLDDAELVESFIRASGPGGQNVNKVATAVELRFDLAGSPNLSAPVKARAARLAGMRLTKAGVLVIRADRFRTQERNREDARARLAKLLAAAEIKPKPRIATRPSRSQREARRADKAQRSKIKQTRRGRLPDD